MKHKELRKCRFEPWDAEKVNVIQKINDTTTVRKIAAAYKRHERFAPAVSFVAGFTWDSLTLKRIDLLIDNLILFFYIVLLGITILLIHFINEKRISNQLILKYSDWYPLAVQFFLGGLFSAYVVLYFHSAAVTKNWIFLGLLLMLLVGNEFLKDRVMNLKVQFVLYFMAVFSFFIFVIPVLFKTMNTLVFLFSGLVSLGFTGLFLFFLYKKSSGLSAGQFTKLGIIVGGIYLFLNIFYFLNWIPPVPLSLREGGIYHHVSKTDEGYRIQYEEKDWYKLLSVSAPTFHYQPGDTVFCFASVFAPTALSKRIYHHWQFFSEAGDEWKTTDRLSYKITGGRDGGYRGYTLKRNIREGRWRVDVETDDGLLLGRVPFNLVSVPERKIVLQTTSK